MAAEAASKESNPASEQAAGAPREGWRMGVPGGIVCAVLGGALTWAVLAAWFPPFHVPHEFDDMPSTPPPEMYARFQVARAATLGYNTMFALGLLGASVAGLMAVGEGIARRSVAAMLGAGAVCAVAGAEAGCLAGFAGHLIWKARMSGAESMPLETAILIHAVALVILGGGIGVGLGAVAARGLRAAATGLLAGMLAGGAAGALYPFVGAAVTAYAGLHGSTDVVVPRDPVYQLLWLGLAAVLWGLTIPGLRLRSTAKQRDR
jgi:hypothetical protein